MAYSFGLLGFPAIGLGEQPRLTGEDWPSGWVSSVDVGNPRWLAVILK